MAPLSQTYCINTILKHTRTR